MTTKPTAQRARAAAHWLRDTALGGLGYTLVLTVALAGWSASFIGLHDFGHTHMGLSNQAAWLVPVTFDGAPAGLSIVVMRASTHGRSAIVWRLLVIGFTALSSWINYMHIADPTGRIVASFMPPSAVILFEGLMSETRAAAVRLMGRAAPRLHPLRWFFDRAGTLDLYRRYVLDLPLPATFDANANASASEDLPVPAPASVPVPVAPKLPVPALPVAAAPPVPVEAVAPASASVPAATATPARPVTPASTSPAASASDGDASRDLAEVAAAYRALRTATGKHRPSSAALGAALGLSRSRGQQLRDQLETHPDYTAEFAPALKGVG